MNEAKQKQLWKAARARPPVDAPSNFTAQVLRAIQRDECRSTTVSLSDQLSLLFPRLATAALLIIVTGLTFEFLVSDDLLTQLAQASDQWLLPLDWL